MCYIRTAWDIREICTAELHQPSELDQIVVFETPGLHHWSPDSDELRYKSRRSQKRICLRSPATCLRARLRSLPLSLCLAV